MTALKDQNIMCNVNHVKGHIENREDCDSKMMADKASQDKLLTGDAFCRTNIVKAKRTKKVLPPERPVM